MTEALNALAANIVSRRTSGVDSYILFLGAGASISSGCSSMLTLSEDLLRSHEAAQFNSWETEIADAQKLNATFGDLQKREINEKKIARFLEIWTTLDSETKYAFLRTHLSDGKVPSQGYLDLAYLVKSRFFTTILTTNLDPLLERALLKVGLLQPEDFIVVVNRKDSLSELTDQLENTRAPIKVVKLHGTLESPKSYAFTPEEIFSFEKSIRPVLSRILNQSLIVVGHSMQDRDINMLFEEDGKEIHYINPTAPKRGGDVDKILTIRGVGSTISGSGAAFDNFFRDLRASVENLSSQKLSDDSGSSIEVFLQSIGFEAELKAPRSRYKNLQTLYVKPTEYDDILNKLETDHVVFIIGEPHMGKTYTALYILWEYYQKDYETLHIRHDKLIHLLHRHNNNLKELLLELFSPKDQRSRIIHFDDPFGETSERRTEAFAKGIDTFLKMAKSYEHLRVLVTSRLNIFNEALSEHSAHEDLEQLEKTLRVHTSYRREVLLDIFHRYTKFYTPAWAQDERITSALDEKLPSMLPAPHNIEFFVSTSETLNSLDAVLSHVEESKKMISALAGWMKLMLPHEQIFLMWVEISSTANILFPGSPASEIEIEKSYNKTLAYLFSEGHLPGIPTVPFSSAYDKFETILIERRDDSQTESLRLDFVHPSYHEAFWYAINRKFSLAQWWEFLSNNIARILQDLTNRIDVVQLKMIERYGTINRDLDQLLLLSAQGNDPNEQLIALGHMLNRPERFAMLPQFSACVNSVVSQESASIKLGFLELYERRFDQLPEEVLRVGLPLIFDTHSEVRAKAENVVVNNIHAFPQSLREQTILKQLQLAIKLIPESIGTFTRFDLLSDFVEVSGLRAVIVERIAKLEVSEIQLLAHTFPEQARNFIFLSFDQAWEQLSDKQRQAVVLDRKQITDDEDLLSRIDQFVNDHAIYFLHLSNHYPSIGALVKAQKLFPMIPLDEGFESGLKQLPIEKWPQLSPSDVRELSTALFGIDRLVTRRILEEYHAFSPKNKNAYLKALYLPHSVPALEHYIATHRGSNPPHLYVELEDTVLVELIHAEGRVQYETLSAVLLRLDRLSSTLGVVIDNIITNPPGCWVGASVGQVLTKAHEGLSASLARLPFHIVELKQKQVIGAMLSEMVQSYFDSSIGLHKNYTSLMWKLIEDAEVVRYAEDWMDHSVRVFNFASEAYWEDMKKKMKDIPSN